MYKNKNKYSKSFNVKYVFFSLGFRILTEYHKLKNKNKKEEYNNNLYFMMEKDDKYLKDIIVNNSSVLMKHNSFFLKSFMNREDSINNIIIEEFRKICYDKESFYENYFKYLYDTYMSFLRRNKQIKKVILYDENSVPSLSLLKACNKVGVKTIALQHGMLSKKNSTGYHMMKELDGSYLPTYTLVYSEIERKHLIQGSVAYTKDNVLAMGCPRYDKLKGMKETGEEPYNKEFRILWCTQWTTNKKEARINCIEMFNFVFHYNYDITMKLHPLQSYKGSIYQKENKKFQVDRIDVIEGNKESYEAILNNDIILITNSAIGMEAIILNKPIILLSFTDHSDKSDYVSEGFDIEAKSIEDLDEKIRYVKSKEYKKKFKVLREKYIKKHFKNFGSSSNKVKRFIARC